MTFSLNLIVFSLRHFSCWLLLWLNDKSFRFVQEKYVSHWPIYALKDVTILCVFSLCCINIALTKIETFVKKRGHSPIKPQYFVIVFCYSFLFIIRVRNLAIQFRIDVGLENFQLNAYTPTT